MIFTSHIILPSVLGSVSGSEALVAHPTVFFSVHPSDLDGIRSGLVWVKQCYFYGIPILRVKNPHCLIVKSYKVGPPFTIAKLVNISKFTMVFGTQLTIVAGDYKPFLPPIWVNYNDRTLFSLSLESWLILGKSTNDVGG